MHPSSPREGPAAPAPSGSPGKRSPSAVSTPTASSPSTSALRSSPSTWAATTREPSAGPPPSRSAASRPSSTARPPMFPDRVTRFGPRLEIVADCSTLAAVPLRNHGPLPGQRIAQLGETGRVPRQYPQPGPALLPEQDTGSAEPAQ